MQLSSLNSRPIVWYTSGTIIRQVASLIMLPVYTSYLKPEEYGVIALLSIILGVYELFLGARFGAALPKFYYDLKTFEERASLVSTALLFTASFSVLGSIGFASSSQIISIYLFERSELTTLVAFFSVTLTTSSIEEYSLIYLRLREKPFYFFISSIFKLLLQLSSNIYLIVYLEEGLAGFIYASIISSSIMSLLLGAYTLCNTGLYFVIGTISSLWRYCWPLWTAGFFSIYITLATNFIIKFFCSLEELGLYHFALKFSSLLTVLVWQPFNQWWQVERFKVYDTSTTPSAEFGTAFTIIFCIMLTGVVCISLSSPTLISLMADPSYFDALYLIPYLCVLSLFAALGLFVRFPLLKFGATKLIPKIVLLNASLVTLFVPASAYFFGIKGVVISLMLIRAADFLITYFCGQKFFSQDISLTIVLLGVFLTLIYLILILEWSITYKLQLNQLYIQLSCVLIFAVAVIVSLFSKKNVRFSIVKFFRERVLSD
ncbi:lipopolysaccharide biosynthesis protein [Alteromonas sp. S167]|uniref:lipopolysaccharide biosynthesis protein n=1 Tax=Alteromonas sp. S167 TaxID=3117402 RepID=UPI002FE32DBA